MRSIFKKAFFSLFFMLFLYAFGQSQATVYDVIKNNPDLQKLEEAMNLTGLRSTFSQNGTYTIIAPTNAALSTIPTSTFNNPTAMREIILTHCLNAYYRSADLFDGAVISTMNNRNLTVSRNGTILNINGNIVQVRDIIASNGIVHIIDAWIPKSRTTETTLWSIISNSTNHIALENIILQADLRSEYLQSGKRTVFAPTDEAFFALSDERFDRLFGSNINYIKNFLDFHIVNSDILFSQLNDGVMFTAANGQELTIAVNINGTYVNTAKIKFSAITAVNGRVYVIEKVLIPQDIPPYSYVDFVNESLDHTILSNAIESTDLTDAYSADGNRTYFAPTDAAFNLIDPLYRADLFADPAALANVLNNHVLATRRNEENLIDVEMDVAINGYDLTFTEAINGVFVDNAEIIVKDIIVDNGIVHVIDAVLLEIIEPYTVYDVISEHDSLTQYHFYVLKHNFKDTLDGQGPFTVFAPSDEAIAMMPVQFLDDLNSITPSILDELVESHIIKDFDPLDSLEVDEDFLAINGFALTVGSDSLFNLFINQSGIIVTDLLADNGVVHIIDAVTNPIDTFFTIFDYVSQSADHNTLESLIRSSGLQSVYDVSGTLTFFAPTDEAFDNLPTSVLSDIINDPTGLLIDVLLGHTLQEEYTSDELELLSAVLNSNSQNLIIEVINGDLFINNAQIIVRDVDVDNGIVHVIDAVIGLEEEITTVFDIIVESTDHEQLESFIRFAELDDDLINADGITVFAPTDAAFQALSTDVLNQLMSVNTDFLIDVLNFHTANDLFLSNTFVDGQKILMSNGEETTITVNNGELFINNAQIIVEDLLANNGIVHVIDAVILEAIDLPTVYDIVNTETNLSTLKQAVDAAGLQDDLTDDEDITFFAPTNEAFNALPTGVLDELFLSPTSDLRSVLLNHKHDNYLASSDFVNGERLLMSNGEEVTILIRSNGFFVNNALIEIEDIVASNGIVHVIDAVLYTPPNITTVYDLVEANSDLSFLKDAVLSSGLKSDLEGGNKVTLFAPTNAAFNSLPNDVLSSFFTDPTGILRELLMGHMYDEELLSSQFVNGQNLLMMNGNISVLSMGGGMFLIDDAMITVRDVEADNGVLHIIDSVINLEPNEEITTVFDIISESDQHTILEDAIVSAGLTAALSGTNLVTVFAPTDAAFNALPPALLTQLLADPTGQLNSILMRHFFNGQVATSNLINNSMITMADGSNVTVIIDQTGIYINGARITLQNITADNGIVHYIDAVLIPDELRKTVFQVIQESAEHTIFESMIISAGLESNLSGFSDVTVFAPTDIALNALDPNELELLMNDPTGLLRTTLLYHMTTSDLPFSSLTPGLSIIMSTGQNATISQQGNFTYIQDAWVQHPDMIADNGRVHGINNLISPSTSVTDLKDLGVAVYPNPTQDIIHVNLGDLEIGNYTIRLINNLGQLVKTVKTQSHQLTIDVSDLMSGIYYISIDNFEKSNVSFVKQ